MTANDHKELEVSCPFCKAMGTIKIPTEVYSQKKWGTVKIQVPPGAICKQHHFIVLVDTKGIIRGTEKVEDVIGRIGEKKDDIEETLTLVEIIEKVGLDSLKYVLHALILNYPIYVVKSDELNSMERVKFILDQVVTEDFRSILPLIKIIEERDVQKVLLNEQEALVISSGKEILQTPWKEKLKYEEAILRKAGDLFNEGEQLVILQQEVAKLARDANLARYILEYNDELSREEFSSELTKKMRVKKVDRVYINMIKLFVEKRFSKELVGKIKKRIKVRR